MKKKIIMVFSAILLLCLMALPVKATGISINGGSGYRGDTITVSVKLSETVKVRTGAISFQYDTTSLDITDDSGSFSVPGATINYWDPATELGTFLLPTFTDVSGTIFTADFKILNTADFKDYTITATIQLEFESGSGRTSEDTTFIITVNCNHSYTKKEATEANKLSDVTCTQKAKYYYTCEHCGAKGTETFESGETLSHTYDQKVTTATYLASAADCQNRAKYYYSCECGAKGAETFESGDLASHNYTNKDTAATYKKADADCEHASTYYYSCTGCGAKGTTTFTVGEKLAHTGGIATCTEKAVCDRCKEPYGETLPHTYNQKIEKDAYLKSKVTCTTPKTYYYSCKCGAKGTETFTVGSTIEHSFTKQSETYKYLAVSGTCTTKAKYYYSCEYCGAKGTETFESKYAPSHSYSKDWSSDKDGHWHECLYCTSTSSYAKHNPGPAATETTPQTCKDCGYVIQAALGHTHNYKTEYSYDATKHWHACDCGDKKDVAAHTYDNDCDTDCNDCGYIRTINHEYGSECKSDATGHWYECTKCGAKSEVEAHIPGAEATETSAQTCTICGYELHSALEHTHEFDEWACDEVKHWKVCSCGETSGEENHEYGEGVVTKEATEDEEGVMTYTCKDCGHEKTEAIEKVAKKGCKSGCKKDLSVLVVGTISLSMVGVLLKKREN